MTELEVKKALHKLIDKTEDMNVLKSVLLILNKISEKKETDFWDVISEEEKASIEKGLSQARKGELISNDDVLREVREKYGL